MARQSLLWTVLPNGYSDDKQSLRVSVLVSPRLDAEANPQALSSFPDFVSWPETVAKAKFTVHFGANAVAVSGSDTTSPSRVDKLLGGPDTTAWKALLPHTTFVRGFGFQDLSTNHVLSYPAAAIDTLVRTLYTALAATPNDELPKVSEFLEQDEWSKVITAVASNDRRFLSGDGKTRDPQRQFDLFRDGAFKNLGSPAGELALLQLFHTPPSTPEIAQYSVPPGDPKSYAKWLAFKRTQLPKPEDFAKEIDFHQIVSAMNQYPTLLRRLGLVVDLLIAKAEFAPSPKALLWVEVALPSLPPGSTVTRRPDVSMRTRALLDAKRFQPLPRPAPGPGDYSAADGLLVLSPKLFRLVQVDGDGAGLKVMNFARTLGRMKSKPDQQRDPVTQHEREEGAPALRNAGLMLAHTHRGPMLENSFDRQKAYNAAIEHIQGGGPQTPAILRAIEMFAEDVVRGYHIDIWDSKARQWRSLCQRVADYDINAGAVLIHVDDEEGTLRLGATKSPETASNPDLIWLHEVLVSWTGWSLCARPPGRTIHHQATEKDASGNEVIVHKDPVGEAEAEVPPGLRLETAFKVLAGSLPRLRYGRAYWIRARLVDLASNSLPPNAKDFGPEAPTKNQVSYLRYEPIAAPALALVKQTPATVEAPAEGESMERMAVRTFNEAPAQNSVPSMQIARRFAVPSRATAREAELHGMLDKGGEVDPATFAMLAAKDNSLAEETLMLKGPLDLAPAATRFAVCNEGQALPYLPDPLAVSVVARIFGHPTFGPDKLIAIPLYSAASVWPDAEPFKIELYENPADAPHFVEAQRTLFIPLPKGVRATLRLSVRPTREALALLGVWHWLTPVQKAAMQKRALSGQHWMLTPWRHVELVHAVQKPLITPKITQLRIDRGLGRTDALPNFIATCSIKSTDHLDLRAEWNEPIEDVSQAAAGVNRARTDHAFAIKITDEKSYAGTPEYLLIGQDLVQAGGAFHDLVAEKFHEFNDTRYRRIEYWLDATTKFREFMPASVLTKVEGGKTVPTDERIKVFGEKVVGWIPNSSPPPAPEVLYVVPTFGWVRTKGQGKRSSWRRGGGLRVYLNRPWNVSGYGEMLAVVLPPAAFVGDPNTLPAKQPLKKFVTQWGNDPIWLSPGVVGVAPKPGNFPLARTIRDPEGKWLPTFAPKPDLTEPSPEANQPPGAFRTTALLHPETASATTQFLVDVAPHDVFYDEERRLWYCDIEVNWGTSYYPFIRLALARYQPVSVGGAHLSNIVLADFMPLVSDRWLSVSETPEPKKRQVSLFGSTYTDSSASAREAAPVASTSTVEVWVERFHPELGEDFGWRREPDALVTHELAAKGPPVKAAATPGQLLAQARKLLKARQHDLLLKEGLVGKVFLTPPLWKGSVLMPQAPGGSLRYRIAIVEYEEYLVDDGKRVDPPWTKKDRRLVFIEYVELS